ncbi:enoyl-CoA hydratase/isomerase family protein [Campylobacter sp. RM16188]|uniref:enoyl-CoA hydratase/isomerase family protein n=1 Tax=Campylobacter sp. RM16188 TaxID=1705725 RepID=UPI001556B65F|nr:enoyl-CoA hydratase-related protein [Campylobacter sp. RM16188]
MRDYHGSNEVISELREDGILILTINRPEKRNALNGATSAKMEEILNMASKDNAVRVIIVTGSGEKAFCAGEDLSELAETGECQTVTEHGFGGLTNRLCPKPIICAVNGTAVGGGMEIAVACDLIVSVKEARFGLPEVKVGLIASTGGLVRMARELPRKIAMELCLTGKLIYAEEAKEIGIVNYVVEREELMNKAIELAEQIAANAPISLQITKEILHAAPSMSLEDAMRLSDNSYKYIEKTEDGIEGPLAFMEKRKPNWKGK